MKNLKIGEKLTKFPLIQGGMGVGISLGRLAGTVAKEGGIGIISTAQIGYREKDFDRNTEVRCRAPTGPSTMHRAPRGATPRPATPGRTSRRGRSEERRVGKEC